MKTSITIAVKVIPNSKISEVSYDKENKELVVKLRSKPVRGEANEELLQILKKKFGSKVKILKGKFSRKKLVLLEEVEESLLRDILK